MSFTGCFRLGWWSLFPCKKVSNKLLNAPKQLLGSRIYPGKEEHRNKRKMYRVKFQKTQCLSTTVWFPISSHAYDLWTNEVRFGESLYTLNHGSVVMPSFSFLFLCPCSELQMPPINQDGFVGCLKGSLYGACSKPNSSPLSSSLPIPPLPWCHLPPGFKLHISDNGDALCWVK